MKTKASPSKNVIDKRNRRVEPDIVGIAKRNADAVQWMRSRGEVPEKVKTDMGNALTYIRRKNAVKQTRATKIDQILRHPSTKAKTSKKQDRLK